MKENFVFSINPRMRDCSGNVTEECKTLNSAWPATAEQVLTTLERDDVKRTVGQLRESFNENVKLWELPYACPHYSAFRNALISTTQRRRRWLSNVRWR